MQTTLKETDDLTMDTDSQTPAEWNSVQLQENLFKRLYQLAIRDGLEITVKRIRFQVKENDICQRHIQDWPKYNREEKRDSWQVLLEYGYQCIQNITPKCVQCGVCCRKSSPTLFVQDIDLVRSEKIPFNSLMTLRKGEPARSPFRSEPFYLQVECIKIKEKPHTTQCIHFDPTSDQCSIYTYRPYQCRVQSCWENEGFLKLKSQALLTRRELFAEVETLLEIITEHSNRCTFTALEAAFDRLKDSEGKNIGEVLELMAFEDHFRHFMGEKLNLPEGSLDLFFGRSFSSFAPIFGFRVEDRPDGTHVLSLLTTKS